MVKEVVTEISGIGDSSLEAVDGPQEAAAVGEKDKIEEAHSHQEILEVLNITLVVFLIHFKRKTSPELNWFFEMFFFYFYKLTVIMEAETTVETTAETTAAETVVVLTETAIKTAAAVAAGGAVEAVDLVADGPLEVVGINRPSVVVDTVVGEVIKVAEVAVSGNMAAVASRVTVAEDTEADKVPGITMGSTLRIKIGIVM